MKLDSLIVFQLLPSGSQSQAEYISHQSIEEVHKGVSYTN
jgi:hypothetical protein